jgi:HAD superfamily hydrolase (TIGR01509 family)
MNLQALIFDVDGTIADTEEVHRQSFNAAFEHFALGWNWSPEKYRDLLAVTGGKERIRAFIDTLQLTEPQHDRLEYLTPVLHEEKTRRYTEQVRAGAVPLRSGVRRLFEEARAQHCRLAIASTTTYENVVALIERSLGAAGMLLFDVVACGDVVPAKKPAPDIYRLALRRLGVAAEDAIAFEDSSAGLQSALGAGLRTVVTPTFWTAQQNFSGAALLLPALGDPASPLVGEPGRQLRRAAWLGLDELAERFSCAAPVAAATR